MTSGYPWECPYCSHFSTITASNYSSDVHHFSINGKDGDQAIYTYVVSCPNPKCRETSITADLYKSNISAGRRSFAGTPKKHWNLKPDSGVKVFPDYIPQVLINDYTEASKIKDLSPKASATLSRRCLQGIIRDFWGITRKRLIDEIRELEGQIDNDTWEAIDAVRSIGNIGAHMESDINFIIDVDPEEAELLIGLIEILFKDCYVSRYERQQHLKKIVQTAESKKAQISQGNLKTVIEETNSQLAKPAPDLPE